MDAAGQWRVRDDVWISYLDRKGPLTVGYGARQETIGPELGFGWVMGDALDEPVLLIKCAWGGKSLAVDFRPPSAGKLPYSLGEKSDAAIAQDPAIVGKYYRETLALTKAALANLKELVPGSDGRYVLAGFGWHQGWNDRINDKFNAEYESNLAHFIRDIRKDLGVPALPFVIAETGMTGPEEKHPRALSLMKAQAAVAERAEFKGNVAFVGTKAFWRPAGGITQRAGLSLELERRNLLPHRRGDGRGDEAAPHAMKHTPALLIAVVLTTPAALHAADALRPDSGPGVRGAVVEADVCVYGSTPSGVMAAVQAARLGKSVVMVTPDQHLGGMSSSGLGFADTGNTAVIGGLAREFHHRIWQHYEDPRPGNGRPAKTTATRVRARAPWMTRPKPCGCLSHTWRSRSSSRSSRNTRSRFIATNGWIARTAFRRSGAHHFADHRV